MNRNHLSWLVIVGVVAVALAVAGVPFGALLPFAVLLACPLMMVFMMKGMHGMHGGGESHVGHGCEHDPTRTHGPRS
jgi:choline-glycine betaine transporter